MEKSYTFVYLCILSNIYGYKIRYMVYAAECVSKIETILAIIFLSISGAVCLQLTPFTCHDCENVYFILLSSSNPKYESLTIV